MIKAKDMCKKIEENKEKIIQEKLAIILKDIEAAAGEDVRYGPELNYTYRVNGKLVTFYHYSDGAWNLTKYPKTLEALRKAGYKVQEIQSECLPTTWRAVEQEVHKEGKSLLFGLIKTKPSIENKRVEVLEYKEFKSYTISVCCGEK